MDDATQPMTDFDRAIALDRLGDDEWSGAVQDGWDIGGIANGGYLMALAAVPMLALTELPDPLTVTAHYLAPVPAGPIRVRAQLLRKGRRLGTARAELVQGDRVVLQALGTFGDVAAPRSDVRFEVGLPELPPPEQCIGQRDGDASHFIAPPIADRVETRLHPEHIGFAIGEPTGRAEVGGWARFADGRPVDGLAALLFADAFPPSVFNSGLPIGWVPTVELTVHVHKRPSPGWVGAFFSTDHINNGFLEEDGLLWDGEGDVVAMSRQLAILPQ